MMKSNSFTFLSSKIAALIVVISASIASKEASAQDDSQKRRSFLPYIRATTDCVANATRHNKDFSQHVIQGNIYPIMIDALKISCISQAAEMIRIHDVLYGGGGANFLTNAYLNDLDRAVRARIAPHIESVKQEAVRIEAMKREQQAREAELRAERVATAEKVRDTVRDRALSCVFQEAGQMLHSTERAEVVAKASMIFCEKEVNAFAVAVRDLLLAEGTNPSVELNFAAKQRVEEILVANIVKVRSERMRPKEESSPNSQSTL